MGRARELEVEDLLAGLRAQSLDERARLPVRHEVVAGALHDEERHEARSDEGHGRPMAVALGILGRRRAEHQRSGAPDQPPHPRAAVLEEREQVGGWIQRYARQHRRVGRLEAGLVLGVVHRQRGHRGEVGAG